MIVDVNILLYAADAEVPEHERARAWLEDALNGPIRIGLPWPSLTGFLRIATDHRAMKRPIPTATAWALVESWLAAGAAWIPTPTDRHAEVLGRLLSEGDVRGRRIPDTHLAALAIEHGVGVCSADTDFARFAGVRWFNPVAASAVD